MKLQNTLLSMLVLCGLAVSGPSVAHSPHDNIVAMAVAHPHENEPAIFAVVAKTQVLRSTDGGYFWTELNRGLDNLHLFTAVAASAKTDVALLATDGDGIFRSTDLGESWGRASAGLTDLRIAQLYTAPDFASSGVAYALSRSGQLFRSTDQGVSWKPMSLDLGPISTLAFKGHEASQGLYVGTLDGRIAEVDFDSPAINVLHDQKAAGVIRDIAVVAQPDKPTLVFAGTEKGGILRSEDGGTHFSSANTGVSASDITTVGSFQDDTENPTIVALGWNEAAFLSNDGGKSWTLSPKGLSTSQQATTPVHFSPQFMDFAVLNKPDGGDKLLIAGFDGFFRSDDGGKSWNQYQVNPPGLFDAMELSPPVDDDFCVAMATYGSGVFRKCGSEGEWQVLGQGIPEWSLHTVMFSPAYARDKKLLASGSALYSITGNSDQWTQVETNYGWFDNTSRWLMRKLRSQAGLPASITTDLLAHPQPPFLIKVALPADFPETGKFYATTMSDGVLTVDSASGEVEILKPRDTFTQDILLSPAFAHDGTLFVSARDDGIWKSSDRGKTWQDAASGLDFLADWRAVKSDATYAGEAAISGSYELRLAMSPGFASDHTLFAGSSAGLYRTQDGGATWSKVGDGLGSENPIVAALAISPDYVNDHTVMVSILGHSLFVSEDGGNTFRPAAPDDARVADFRIHIIAFSPRYAKDGRVLAASDRHLLQSHDRGAHWRVEAIPMRIEGAADEIRFDGKWQRMRAPTYSANQAWTTSAPGSRLTVPIYGTGVRILGSASPGTEFVLKIDGGAVPMSKLTVSTPEQKSATWIELSGLGCGSHMLELELAPTTSSGGKNTLVFDGLDVVGNTCDLARYVDHRPLRISARINPRLEFDPAGICEGIGSARSRRTLSAARTPDLTYIPSPLIFTQLYTRTTSLYLPLQHNS